MMYHVSSKPVSFTQSVLSVSQKCKPLSSLIASFSQSVFQKVSFMIPDAAVICRASVIISGLYLSTKVGHQMIMMLPEEGGDFHLDEHRRLGFEMHVEDCLVGLVAGAFIAGGITVTVAAAKSLRNRVVRCLTRFERSSSLETI